MENAHRLGRVTPDRLVVQTVGLIDEPASEHRRGDRVDQPHPGDGNEQERAGDRRPRVEDHLETHLRRRAGHAEHRHVDAVVILLVLHRERPVVGGRPEEDEDEEHGGRPVERSGDGGPADDDGEAAGDPAPDDVLLGTALEDHRVDDDVEEDRGRREHRRKPVGGEPEPDRREDRQGPGEDQRAPRRHFTGDERAIDRSLHVRVDVAIEVHVERGGGAGAQRPADHGRRDQPQVGQASLGKEHDRDRGDEQELQDTRLGEDDICPYRPLQRTFRRHRRGDRRDADRLLLIARATPSSYGKPPKGTGRRRNRHRPTTSWSDRTMLKNACAPEHPPSVMSRNAHRTRALSNESLGKGSGVSELQWDEIDRRAVDTAR
ncbi:hypothetical protein ABE10_03350, partial [Bacillus toyonensis]|nr:hypothetical protein [Bacillus toyonensis]